jgi:methylmalonyl-CoA mutase N-terminal domain/subunit
MRGTMQSLSLVLAGVQAIEISAFDEALRTPSRESHLVSLRTQQVIDLESGVTKVADPLGGSYYVEALTDEIEKRIWDMVLDIESRGDIEDLVDQGYFKDIFHGVMERHSQNIASGDDLVVGVNVHQMSAEDDTMLRDLTDSKFPPCKDHIERIKAYKEGRDQKRLKAGLEPIVEAAKTGSGNLLALTIDAFEAGATMGEVSGSFRVGCGEAYDPHGQMEAVI